MATSSPQPDPAEVPPAMTATTAPAPAAGAPPAPAGVTPRSHRIRRTRIGGIWLASALFAVVLLLLLIFILENGNKIEISYFGAHGHMPLGVALLLAAVLGILLVVIPGTARIIQLRITARRHRRMDASASLPQHAGVANSADMPPGA